MHCMKSNYSFFLVLLCVFILISCKKDGKITNLQNGVLEVDPNLLSKTSQNVVEDSTAELNDKQPEMIFNPLDFIIEGEEKFGNGNCIIFQSNGGDGKCKITFKSGDMNQIIEEKSNACAVVSGRNDNEKLIISTGPASLIYVYIIDSEDGLVKKCRTAVFPKLNNIGCVLENNLLYINNQTEYSDMTVSVDLVSSSTEIVWERGYHTYPDVDEFMNKEDGICSYYSEDDKFLKIDKDNKLLTYNFDGEEKSEELKIEKKSKIKYLTISSKKYVLLNSNEICVLIDELGNLLFQGNFYHSILEKRYRAKSVFEATSFLNDGKKAYLPEYLNSFKYGEVWADRVESDGVGESITIKTEQDLGGLFIFNGYVSYDKPWLFEDNARIKSIRIYDSENDEIYRLEIKDSPDPFYIPLPIYDEQLKLVVTDVYHGNKYDDLCVNSIIGIYNDYDLFGTIAKY